MKKFLPLFAIAIFTFTSCSNDGERGPQGPAGPPGDDGLIGVVFDVAADDFTEGNGYGFEVEYSDYTSEEVFETDVVLVYMKTGEDGQVDGQPVEIWSLLPQVYYVDGGGSMQYNYDYTFFSTYIYLDGDVDLSTLDSSYTDDQVFRIAIIPAGIANDASVDFSSYEEVMSAMKVKDINIPAVE
ncbi:collagen-like protein [Salinimicrobium sp. GXAS 041]|uniref:collagen-like protein n=1 Tax=Salinimicrobium sp. GXAS 041 TaxID=3400806 RepID=UPI003C787AD1